MGIFSFTRQAKHWVLFHLTYYHQLRKTFVKGRTIVMKDNKFPWQQLNHVDFFICGNVGVKGYLTCVLLAAILDGLSVTDIQCVEFIMFYLSN